MPFVLNGPMQFFSVTIQNVAELTGHRPLRHRHSENLLPDTTNASVPAVTVWRSSLTMYVFFDVNTSLSPVPDTLHVKKTRVS
jgi:hypothetical protein